jgi:D-alanyl-D-alanine carboxypeptidase
MPFTEPARAEPRRIRIRRIRLAGLLAAMATIAGLVHLWPASSFSTGSSSSTATPPIHVPRREHARPPGEIGAPVPGDDLAALGEADGAVPEGVTVFDTAIPGVARLDPDLLTALRRAATEAKHDGVEFVVDSGWRSAAYQDHLLQAAISKYGSHAEAARWVASPRTSAHVSGDAVDIGPSSAAEWLSEHGADYGLCQIYRNEPWHYEQRPNAIGHGCPAMYADPTEDPRTRPR